MGFNRWQFSTLGPTQGGPCSVFVAKCLKSLRQRFFNGIRTSRYAGNLKNFQRPSEYKELQRKKKSYKEACVTKTGPTDRSDLQVHFFALRPLRRTSLLFHWDVTCHKFSNLHVCTMDQRIAYVGACVCDQSLIVSWVRVWSNGCAWVSEWVGGREWDWERERESNTCDCWVDIGIIGKILRCTNVEAIFLTLSIKTKNH